MTQRAATVVIGAGIVGACTAYHLARLGHDDILILDQGDLPHNPGSTSHAPGGVVAMSHNRLLARMSFYTTELYRRLDPYADSRRTYNPVGSIEVARNADRMADLVREHGEAMAFGADTDLLDAAGVVEKVPYLDPSVIEGGLFIPASAIISGVNVTAALLRDAQRTGRVRVQPNTTVIDVEGNGHVTAVVTADGGHIETERVVLCTNIWALPLRRQIQPLPLLAFEHQYVESADVLDGFDADDPDDEVTVPTVRDLDVGLYYRHHWNRVGVGSYHHAPLPVAPEDVGAEAERPFTPEHFDDAWKAAVQIIPALGDSTAYTRAFNGMFAFSIDGMPIIGETSVGGLWMAVASWITHAGGVGKSVAEMITSGEAEWDLREASIDRFHPHQTTGGYVRAVTTKNYREVYEIHHPHEPPTAPRNVRLSPFHAQLADRFRPHNIPFGGIELAAWYESNEALLEGFADRIPERSEWASRHRSPIAGAEHLACRESAALFDLTGLSIVEVSGRQAAEFVDHLCSNRMDVPVGRVVYTTWLTDRGKVKRDLAVARLGDRYWMFVGEGTRPQDLAWARRHADGFPGAAVTDVSDAYTALGLWGPAAPALLERVVGEPIGLRYFAGRWIEIGLVRVYAMRISYVGEAGYELHIPVDQAPQVFERIHAAAEPGELVMAGSAAMDSLRIEKGYRLWGADVHTEYDPFEAGLAWTVRLDKDAFLGAEACRELSRSHPARRLSCLLLRSGDPLGNEAVIHAGETVAYVTSAAYGYSVGASVAYAYLPSHLAAPGTAVNVLIEGTEHRAVVSEEPVWDPAGERLRT